MQHGHLRDRYPRANDGNIALTGEVDLVRSGGRFVLALAFGSSPAEAGADARAGLLRTFSDVRRAYINEWTAFHRRSIFVGEPGAASDAFRIGVAMLQTHEDKAHPGALIASLSIPWGDSKGDHDLGGYHLVWPRDLVEGAGGLLAAGHSGVARQALHYLMTTQEADGHWPQNMWLDGTPYWSGTQMDETGFPILLADQLRRHKALGTLDAWPMVRRAAAYLVRNGPVTPEDRWEEDGGYSPFTLAVEIAALLAAADFAEAADASVAARYLRETADAWNDAVERWTYVTDTPTARAHNVDGYYVRIAPVFAAADDGSPRLVSIKNHPRADMALPYGNLISPDALALVRFGLRAPDDPRIVNTVTVIDRLLRVETATGPAWHRYNEDGYGEHDDGAPFDGSGVGRGWPLLAGERAHYELAAGRKDEAERLATVMRAQASLGGLLPEQVWDAADVPARELRNGRPAGSAMPLVWAHAEYVKLTRSIRDGRVFDTPPQTRRRYIQGDHPAAFAAWRFNHRLRTIRAGLTLRIETRARALVRWTADAWATATDTATQDSTLGMWYAELPSESWRAGTRIDFTFHWPEAHRWEGMNFSVSVVLPDPVPGEGPAGAPGANDASLDD